MTRDEALRRVPDKSLLLSLAALGLLTFDDEEKADDSIARSIARADAMKPFVKNAADRAKEQIMPRTEPPPEWGEQRYHWLLTLTSRGPHVAEWMSAARHWIFCSQTATPENLYRDGWRWYAPAIPPAEWQGKRVDAP